MRSTLRVVFVLAFLFLFLSSSWALIERAGDRPSSHDSTGTSPPPNGLSPATANVTTVSVTASHAEIIPILVEVRKPLHDIQVSYIAAEAVRMEEIKKYDEIRLNAAKASSDEKKALSAQLATERRRVLLATLNSMTLIYQRARYVVEGTDSGLVALRSKYNASSASKRVTDFEGRMYSLERQRQALLTQSTFIQHKLEATPSSVELGASLLSTKMSLSELISGAKSYLEDYSRLVQAVVSTS